MNACIVFWFMGLLGAARDLMLLAICNREYLSFNFLYRPAGARHVSFAPNPRVIPGVIIISLLWTSEILLVD